MDLLEITLTLPRPPATPQPTYNNGDNNNNQQIDRALRDINRVCQADGALAAWRADRVFTRPAVKRVVEAKASARRLAARRFKAHMRWVMARRERGF